MMTTSKNRFLTGNFKSTIVNAGEVELHTLSPYLSHIPMGAKAHLLVTPRNLAGIDGQGPGTWTDSIKRIRDIKDYYGLAGMQAFDRPETAPDVSYEQDWANQITALFNQAQRTGEIVVSPLFLGTKEIVHGKKDGQKIVTVPTNLYSLRNVITEQSATSLTSSVTKSILDRFTAKNDPSCTDQKWCATDLHCENRYAYIVGFEDEQNYPYKANRPDNSYDHSHKNVELLHSQPVALTIFPN